MNDDVTNEEAATATGDTASGARPSEGAGESPERLAEDLADERRTSAELRRDLDALNAKVAELQAAFDQRLAESETRAEAAEAKVAEQRTRLEALGAGREETMRALSAARDELARMAVERDEIRKQLVRTEALQTETITLPDDEVDEGSQIHEILPSIDELMANLSSFGDAPGAVHEVSHLHTKVENADDDSQEMIAPELVFPEQYGDGESGRDESSAGRVSKILVLLDADPPLKYPLYKGVMTIGRANSADVQINSDYVSRVHARIVSTDTGAVIEDVHSKNGLRVNAKSVNRHELRHGDVIAFGTLRFTFIDTDAVGGT